jgi:hypothetical protein
MYFNLLTVNKMKMKVEEENRTRRVPRNEKSSKSDGAWYRGFSRAIEKVASSFAIEGFIHPE